MTSRWSLLLLLAGCGDSEAVPARVEVAQFPAVETRQLDLLFLIDNSSGTLAWQAQLARAMPAFVASLAGGDEIPNLHVGVITPDLGTTGSLQPTTPAPPVGMVGQGGCAGAGDDGALRSLLVDVDDGFGARIRNYDGALSAALGTAIQIGSDGCGFEQHLRAIRRARDTNPELWRPDAATAVVALVDEDDCSALDPRLFDADAAALGPQQSFRCTRYGVTCDQSLDTAGPKTNCRPDTSSSLIEDPALTKAALELATSPARTTLSVIAGPATPFAVEERATDGARQLALGLVCDTSAGISVSTANPSPRLAALTESFASRGGFYSVCDPDQAPAVRRIAKTIQRSLGVACLDDDVLAVDLATCTAHEIDGARRTELARCPSTSTSTCFDIAPDVARCAGGQRVTLERRSSPSPTAHVEVACTPRTR